MIEELSITNFMAFKQLDVIFSPKINVIIGENGTGKTHLLKAAYALCSANNEFQGAAEIRKEELERAISEKLLKLFLPADGNLGKLHRNGEVQEARLTAEFGEERGIALTFNKSSTSVEVQENRIYEKYSPDPVFLPTKEVLSFMEGFVSLYNKYHMPFDGTYYDLCSQLDLPLAQGERLSEKSKWAMAEIEKVVGGKFIFHGGGRVTFKTSQNEYSANTMAEGFRKAGILSRLLETGSIQPGVSGPLLWDEPETNTHPKLMKLLAEIILVLSRSGQQVILATHDYVMIKWFDLLQKREEEDHVLFHALYRESDTGEIRLQSVDDYRQINENTISETFSELYDADINKAFGSL